jgi:6-phosphogluconolactonase
MTTFMYLSLQDDDKILVFTQDPSTGALSLQHDVAVSGGPAALCVDPERKHLYIGRRAVRDIASFDIDPASGAISQIGAAPLEGEPVALATDRKGGFVLSAYYYQSRAAVHRIDENGAAVVPPVEWLETAGGAHSIQTDPTNRFAYVPHIANRGPNEIFQFRFDETTGHLAPNTPLRLGNDSYLGPRHFCFNPNIDMLYFSDEQGCSVSAYRLDPHAGTLSLVQTASTLPEGFEGDNTCSQIQISPSGRFLYAPNRGHNSLACFTVNTATGELAANGIVDAEPIPNALAVGPDEKFLYSAGQESGNMAIFGIDAGSGQLTRVATTPLGNRPAWISIVHLP